MNSDHHYIVNFSSLHKEYYALWKDGGKDQDRFARYPKSSTIIFANTKNRLLALAATNEIPTKKQVAQKIDLELVHRILKNIRPSRPPSQNQCEVLLECWNALEDLANTLEKQFFPTYITKSEANAICQKLFKGNNIPKSKSLSICRIQFSPREIWVIRRVIREAERKTVEALEGPASSLPASSPPSPPKPPGASARSRRN